MAVVSSQDYVVFRNHIMHDLKMKIICTYYCDSKFKTEFRVSTIGLYDPVVHVVIQYLTFLSFIMHCLTQKQKKVAKDKIGPQHKQTNQKPIRA